MAVLTRRVAAGFRISGRCPPQNANNTMIRSNVSPAAVNPGKEPGSAIMAGSSSPKCSASNTAFHFTFTRPGAYSSVETGSTTLTERIKKNRQGNQGLILPYLPCDSSVCLARSTSTQLQLSKPPANRRFR